MTHKRRLAALLCSLLLACSIGAVPALATEGGIASYAENSGVVTFPTEKAPPTPTPEPTPTPTPEPTPAPTPEPTPTPSSGGSPSGGGQQTYTPPDTGSSQVTGNGGGVVVPAVTARPSPSPSASPAPSPSLSPKPSPSATARPSGQTTVQRPRQTLDSSQAGSGDGANYVTFARLNQKNSTLVVTLFYGGASCIAAGGIGLVVLFAMILRSGRQSPGGREEILQKIENAENRQAAQQSHISSTPDIFTLPPERPRSQATRQNPPRERRTIRDTLPELGDLGVSRGDENKAPPAAPPRGERSAEPEPPVPAKGPNAPIVPMAASLYTEEFSLPDEEEAPPRKPAPPPRPMAERLRQTAHRPPPEEKPAEKKQAVKEPPSAPPPAPPPEPPKEEEPPAEQLSFQAETLMPQTASSRKASAEKEDGNDQLPGQISFNMK